MSLTFNSKTYNGDSFQKDMIAYIGSQKTVTIKDDLRLARTAPKGTATFSGQGRTSAKLTRSLVLTSAATPLGDAIVDVQVSVPVGYASADVDAMLNDMGAFLSSASFKAHVKSQQINF